jgi:16S rRNA (uracil1498-N3)-methyltransferase
MLRAQPFTVPASLGPRILRADTAAISALTLWQAALGDWRS